MIGEPYSVYYDAETRRFWHVVLDANGKIRRVVGGPFDSAEQRLEAIGSPPSDEVLPIQGCDVPIPQDEPAAPAQALTEFPPLFVSVRPAR